MTQLFNKKDFRDNCGFGLIANTHGIKSHSILTKSIDKNAVALPGPPPVKTNGSV